MMDFPLTLSAVFRHAERVLPRREVVTRRADKSLHRYCFADLPQRARRLAGALRTLGVRAGRSRGDAGVEPSSASRGVFRRLRVGRRAPHAEPPPASRRARLHRQRRGRSRRPRRRDAAAAVGEDRASRRRSSRVIVVGAQPAGRGLLDYEAILAGAIRLHDAADPDERLAASMCYTTGTTGKPKGVVYSHRALVLHSVASTPATRWECASGRRAAGRADVSRQRVGPALCRRDGRRQAGVPRAASRSASLLELFEAERVTLTAGVPTIWIGILQILDDNPGAFDLTSLRAMVVGGAAVPPSMIQGFEERHDLNIVHAWGMTEMARWGRLPMSRPAWKMRGRGEIRRPIQTGPSGPVGRSTRSQRKRTHPARRPDHGRARSSRSMDRQPLL